ncbi:hypothetical protein [Angustibacter luteus]|uniref:Uncharacterized protein n=1 Tax=Angustibacter luteus TaxID=658456 RepID=A0ABW1JFP8_9ACTN
MPGSKDARPDGRVTRPLLALLLAGVLCGLLRYVTGLGWLTLAPMVLAVFVVSGITGYVLQRHLDRRPKADPLEAPSEPGTPRALHSGQD